MRTCHAENNCPNSYVYAYDEGSGTALWTCDSALKSDYKLTFCPYVPSLLRLQSVVITTRYPFWQLMWEPGFCTPCSDDAHGTFGIGLHVRFVVLV